LPILRKLHNLPLLFANKVRAYYKIPMRYIFLLFAAFFAFAAITPAFAESEGVAVVVNDEAISKSDVNDRLKLIVTSSGLPNNGEVRAKLTPQVIGSLIDEQLMMQEARRLELTVSPEEVANGFAIIAKQNNAEPEAFRAMLQNGGINLRTMERQIEAQLGWSKVIQAEMRPKVNVTDNDVDDAFERMNIANGTAEFLLAEISLPVEDPARETDVKQLADRIYAQIGGVPERFFKMAQQFSGAAGAAQGGDVGWIQEGQLDGEAATTIRQLGKGDISRPVRSLTGYHIYYLRDLRQAGGANIPSREEVLNRIGVERLERMQRRHLMDLRSAAFIESRV
jgi:peptidyl-prolyl cis-trans isomerase SurA